MSRLLLLAVYFGLFLHISAFVANMELGDKCQLRNGKNGTCVLARDCPTAVNQIKKTKRHDLIRCGFQKSAEIVCCDNSEVETRFTPPGVRKSVKACAEYAVSIPPDIESQILFGEDAKPGEFPHMAALGYEIDNNITWGKCGGTLISYQYVVTAAHCVINQENIQPVVVRLGKIDLLGNSDKLPAQDYEVENISTPNNYDIKTKANDIALLRLKTVVKPTDYVKPCCLYTKDDDPVSLIITGWGHTTQNGEISEILQKAPMVAVDLASCNESFSKDSFARPVLRTQICGTSNDTVPRDTCQGDSGGPVQLISNRESNIYSIVGVTSFGRGCGANLPSIYTRISSYLDWIENIVWP